MCSLLFSGRMRRRRPRYGQTEDYFFFFKGTDSQKSVLLGDIWVSLRRECP